MMKVSQQQVANQENVLAEVEAAYNAVVEANRAYRQNNHIKEIPEKLYEAETQLRIQMQGENAKLIRLRAKRKIELIKKINR